MGFGGRQKYQKRAAYKKYLFVPYAIFFPLPLLHGIGLALSRRNVVYLLHPVLCLYVVFQIACQMGLKVMGIVPEFRSYDGKKKIDR